MYEARQNKEKVSRRIDGDVKQRIKYRYKNVFLNNKACSQFAKIHKNTNNSNETSYEEIGNILKSGREKINFYTFLTNSEDSKEFESLENDFYLNKNRPNSKEEYYKSITPGAMNGNYWINWPFYATGDLTSMSAAISMGFEHGIRLSSGGLSSTKKDKTAKENREKNLNNKLSAISNLKSWLGAEVDKDYLINSDGWKGDVSVVDEQGNLKKSNSEESFKFSWLTRVVAEGVYGRFNENDDNIIEERISNRQGGFNSTDRLKLRNQWLGSDYIENKVDNKIESFLTVKHQIPKRLMINKRITILWIRKSGEKGGAHFENDTSFNALRCYIYTHKDELIILAGDKKGEKSTKLMNLAPKRVFDLTEFWKESETKDWSGNTRTGQYRLYDYLNRISKNKLKHIGSMSGGLEALALLGHEVYFKGKNGENAVKRMEQYQQNPNIKYNRIDFNRHKAIYNYKGFEKSAAKYYVFFSSGIVKENVTEEKLIKLYEGQYNPTIDYKVLQNGLTDNNAKIAYKVSKELAKQEKESNKQNYLRQKEMRRELNEAITVGNPNRVSLR